VFNLGLALCVPLLMWDIWHRGQTPAFYGGFLAFWLTGMGLRVGLGVGQHILLVFTFLLAAFALLKRGHTLWSGLFLALSLHKFAFTVFLLPLFAARRLYNVMFAMAGGAALLLAIFCIRLDGLAPSALRNYAEEMSLWAARSEAGGMATGVTNIYPVVKALVPGSLADVGIMYALLLAGVGVSIYAAFRKRGNISDGEISLFLLLCLWGMYHEQHDMIVLIVPVALWRPASRKHRVSCAGGAGWLCCCSCPACGLRIRHRWLARLTSFASTLFLAISRCSGQVFSTGLQSYVPSSAWRFWNSERVPAATRPARITSARAVAGIVTALRTQWEHQGIRRASAQSA
jgi:hypothetical protein